METVLIAIIVGLFTLSGVVIGIYISQLIKPYNEPKTSDYGQMKEVVKEVSESSISDLFDLEDIEDKRVFDDMRKAMNFNAKKAQDDTKKVSDYEE